MNISKYNIYFLKFCWDLLICTCVTIFCLQKQRRLKIVTFIFLISIFNLLPFGNFHKMQNAKKGGILCSRCIKCDGNIIVESIKICHSKIKWKLVGVSAIQVVFPISIRLSLAYNLYENKIKKLKEIIRKSDRYTNFMFFELIIPYNM